MLLIYYILYIQYIFLINIQKSYITNILRLKESLFERRII